MGDVVDVRPDRFLHVMRSTGSWETACEQSGMTTAEVEELCRSNAKWDLAQLECQLECHEEKMVEATEKAIQEVRARRAERIKQMREKAMAEFHQRRAAYG